MDLKNVSAKSMNNDKPQFVFTQAMILKTANELRDMLLMTNGLPLIVICAEPSKAEFFSQMKLRMMLTKVGADVVKADPESGKKIIEWVTKAVNGAEIKLLPMP